MARRMTTLEVRRTERITPHMVRVVAGGAELAGFPDTPYTDRYVKVVHGIAADGDRPLLNHHALLVDDAHEVQNEAERLELKFHPE